MKVVAKDVEIENEKIKNKENTKTNEIILMNLINYLCIIYRTLNALVIQWLLRRE